MYNCNQNASFFATPNAIGSTLILNISPILMEVKRIFISIFIFLVSLLQLIAVVVEPLPGLITSLWDAHHMVDPSGCN